MAEDLEKTTNQMKLWEMAVEFSPSLVVVLRPDSDCVVLYANQTLMEMVGYGKDEVLGK